MLAASPSRMSRILIAILLPILTSVGCGGFAVDDGIFPMPVVHIVFPAPDLYGIDYENVEIKIENGQTIYGWYVPADDAKATALINHGALFSRSIYAAQIAFFHDLGLNVMIADYQGFGENLSVARFDTILPDANAALEYVRSRDDPGTDRIIIYGVSMGTLPTLAQAAENPEDVLGIIIEGVVQTDTLVPEGYQLLGIPPSPEAFVAAASELFPSNNVVKIKMPKLFIQSLEDIITPYDGALKLFEMSPEPKQLAPVIGIHGLSIFMDPSYVEQVRSFITSIL